MDGVVLALLPLVAVGYFSQRIASSALESLSFQLETHVGGLEALVRGCGRRPGLEA